MTTGIKKSIIYFFIIFTFGVISVFTPLQVMMNFILDDSFFYLKTAMNFVSGLGYTFDGVNVTNGFHPLYFYFIAGLYFIVKLFFTPSPESFLRIIFFIHLVLLLLCQLLILKLYKKEKLKSNYLFTALLSFFFLITFVYVRDFGIESHFVCLFLIILILIKRIEIIIPETKVQTEKYIYYKSIIYVFLFLSRTDFFLTLIPFVILFDILSSDNKIISKSTFIQALPVIIIASVYYYTNYIIFGHFETISSKISNTFPNIVLFENLKELFLLKDKLVNQFVRMVLFFGMTGVYLVRYKNKKNPFDLYLIGVFFGFVMFLFLHLLINNLSVKIWYLTAPMFLIGVTLPYVFVENPQGPGNLNKFFRYSLITLFALFFAYTFIFSRISNFKYKTALDYSEFLKSHLNNNERVLQVDLSGCIGYFSERAIVNGDGLINSFEYFDALKNKKLFDYLKKYNINYYSTYTIEVDPFEKGYFEVTHTQRIMRGRSFEFNIYPDKLVFDYPFIYEHFTGPVFGKWLLFKIN